MFIQGSLESEKFTYIQISVLGCEISEARCEESAFADNTPVSIITLKSHVDFAEKSINDETISYSFDFSNYLLIDTRMNQKMNLFYSEAKVVFDDYALKKFWPPPEVPIFEFNSRYKYHQLLDE